MKVNNVHSGFPSVSVVIPVKNGFPEVKDCIAGILRQTVPVAEILVIDSGSTDGTVEYLKTIHEVRLIQIDAAAFNHGSTRNLGWQNTNTDFLLYTVQDARAVSEYWIEEMLKGFTDDAVVAVCGQQVVPHERDKNPVEWFRPFSQPEMTRYQFNSAADFEQMKPEEQKKICGWDNVTAIYRRTVFNEVQFPVAVFGEDMIWAKRAIVHGHALVYNYNARVYHYHLEDADFTFKRSFTTMYFRYKQFGYVPDAPTLDVRSKLSMLKCLIQSLGTDVKSIAHWYRYNTGQFQAAARAHQLFMQVLQKGEEALDKKHIEICGKPPIPLKVK